MNYRTGAVAALSITLVAVGSAWAHSDSAGIKLSMSDTDGANQALAVAQKVVRVSQGRDRLGRSTILDLLLSQNSLRGAENGHVSARYDYEIARAQLEALVGRQL